MNGGFRDSGAAIFYCVKALRHLLLLTFARSGAL
jgi:hypothetical protein